MWWAIYLLGATASALACPPASAQAVEGELTLHSSYLDIDSFNDRFSANPVAQLTIAIDAGGGFYVEPYLYTGFDRPFGDASSEYGVEMGWEGEIAAVLTANVATGRWANYQGGGMNAGDWFGRIGLRHADFSLSASILQGDSNTILLNAEYELHPAAAVTITPSVAYVTADRAFNPGAELTYRLGPALALAVGVVAPQRAGGREVYGSVGLIWSFSTD